VTRAIQQYCRSAMSESNERVCQFVLDMIRCRDWYGSDECILDRHEICQIIKFLAAECNCIFVTGVANLSLYFLSMFLCFYCTLCTIL